MRSLLFSIFLILILGLCYSTLSFSACEQGPPDTINCGTSDPNPDPDGVQFNIPNDLIVNVTAGGAIDTALQPGLDLDAIQVGTGNNIILLQNAFVRGQDAGIMSGNDNPTHVTINNSTLIGVTDVAIRLGLGKNKITIIDSTVHTTDDNIIQLFDNEEVIELINSELRVLDPDSGLNDILSARGGNDTVSIENSLLVATSSINSPQGLNMDDGNDTVILKNRVVMQTNTPNGLINGLIDCGENFQEEDFDTIIFAMNVPSNQLSEITAEIESKNPSADSIIINGLFYEWVDCEELVPELVAGSAIPTLSQWGLIATAGLLGTIGFIVIRRRKFITNN
ncbi:MAG: IPTL-CTERM sorting domain-containing protein [Thermodesulfobacteriota bacterium]